MPGAQGSHLSDFDSLLIEATSPIAEGHGPHMRPSDNPWHDSKSYERGGLYFLADST